MPDNSGQPGASAPPANLTELEIAFARDPSSDAFIPLCEAYLAQKRFMEAMVSGKKAVKAKPEDKARRLMLARVYEEQGKLPKALEEVAAMIASDPNHSASHAALGRLQLKANQKDAAIAAYKAAVDLDDNADAVAALKALGVGYRKAAPPPPPPPPAAAAPVSGQSMAGPAVGNRARPSTAPRPAPGAAVPAGSNVGLPPAALTPAPQSDAGFSAASLPPLTDGGAPQPTDATPSMTPSGAPRRRPRPRPALTEAELGIASKEPEKPQGLGGTLKLAAVGAILFGVLVAGMTINRSRTESLARLSKPAREMLANDSLVSLRKAQKSFEEMLAIDSSQPLALGGVAYVKTVMVTQYGLAAEKDAMDKALQKASDSAPENSLTVAAKAMLDTKEGRAEKALQDITDMQQKAGDSAAMLVAQGDAYLALGKLEDAGKSYQSARERSSKEARGLWASGEHFRLLGRDRDAFGNFDSVLRMDADHIPARLARVFLRLDAGGAADIQLAQADLGRLSELTEGAGERYNALISVARLELKRLQGEGNDTTRKDLEGLRAKLGTHPDLVLALARANVDDGKAGEAVKILKEAVDKNPSHMGLRIALVKAYTADSKYAEAEAEVARAQTALGQKSLELAIQLGVVRREKKDFKGAEDAFKKAFEIAKDHPRVQLELARTNLEQKKFTEAVALLKSAISGAQEMKASFQAELYCVTAATLLAQGNTQLAMDSVDEALKVDPSFVEAYYWRGLALKATQKDQARAAFQKYLDKLPRGPLAAASLRERDAIR
jgi:tetratricopeptide (TPR) repeat protein